MRKPPSYSFQAVCPTGWDHASLFLILVVCPSTPTASQKHKVGAGVSLLRRPGKRAPGTRLSFLWCHLDLGSQDHWQLEEARMPKPYWPASQPELWIVRSPRAGVPEGSPSARATNWIGEKQAEDSEAPWETAVPVGEEA